MKLSIVIVNYNVKYFLEQCLHAVENATKNIETEVFVVDNNSVDGSCGMVIHKFPNVKLISNKKNFGFSKANNQAILKSTGEYVLLLNPDTVVEEDTFEKVVDFMDQHPEAGGLGVKMIDGKGNFLPESKRGLPTPWVAFYKIFGISSVFSKSKKFGKYHLSFLNQDDTNEVDVLAGAFMMMRKKALDEVGLLDEDFFMYGEDIDLSYRIQKGGFKNYYFPETTIIHYKGESTKKGSLNYVRIFYTAMIIFARKHFSKQYAGIFSFVINMAIYFRAILATIHRLVKALWLPFVDFLLIFLSVWFLLPIWENFRFEPGHFPAHFIQFVVPSYIVIWLVSIYYSGGFERPPRLFNIYRGTIWGTLFILLVYALLPETARFSRAMIFMGAGITIIVSTLVRLVLNFTGKDAFKLGTIKPKRIAIVGLKKESKRVKGMLEETSVPVNLIGYISTKRKPRSERYMGSVYQIKEIVRVNKIEELVFCSQDISSQMVIRTMLNLSDYDVEYKIAPPESVSIIGSNSIDTAGDLYVVNINAITKEKNKRNKRLFDIVFALLFLLFTPILIWFVNPKKYYFKNIFRVLSKQYSWVGYHKINSEAYLLLPAIYPGVFNTTVLYDGELNSDKIDRFNMLYARDYNVQKDLEIVFKSIKKLGE